MKCMCTLDWFRVPVASGRPHFSSNATLPSVHREHKASARWTPNNKLSFSVTQRMSSYLERDSGQSSARSCFLFILNILFFFGVRFVFAMSTASLADLLIYSDFYIPAQKGQLTKDVAMVTQTVGSGRDAGDSPWAPDSIDWAHRYTPLTPHSLTPPPSPVVTQPAGSPSTRGFKTRGKVERKKKRGGGRALLMTRVDNHQAGV